MHKKETRKFKYTSIQTVKIYYGQSLSAIRTETGKAQILLTLDMQASATIPAHASSLSCSPSVIAGTGLANKAVSLT